jgi:RNA polymerase sigma-70 factor (ECF subfamily)
VAIDCGNAVSATIEAGYVMAPAPTRVNAVSNSAPLPAATTIVARMVEGDDCALGALFDAFGSVAYALALAITRAPDAAESVVSEAFAEAWRTASSYDSRRASVAAWLTSIVRRIALRAGSGKPVQRTSAGLTCYAERETTLVGEALGSLTEVQREVVELSYYRGMTVRQIAAHLGKPESGARELLRSAMQQLRSALSSGAALEDHLVTRA